MSILKKIRPGTKFNKYFVLSLNIFTLMIIIMSLFHQGKYEVMSLEWKVSKFLLCLALAPIGFLIEIFSTSFSKLDDGLIGDERLLRGYVPLWMLFVYVPALPFLFIPVFSMIQDLNIILQYIVWSITFTMIEYDSGWMFKKVIGYVPWDYSGNKWKLHRDGLSKYTLLPVWGLAGLAIGFYANYLTEAMECNVYSFIKIYPTCSKWIGSFFMAYVGLFIILIFFARKSKNN